MRAQRRWDEHARFMDQLLAEGFVRLGGPLSDSNQVLLIVEAEDESAVARTLERDPWHPAGLLTLGRVTRWNLLLDDRQRLS
jgi:uncharacterized protein YciI